MVTKEYVWAQSIVDQGGLSHMIEWGGALRSKGDYIILRGMAAMQNYPGTYGSIIRVTHNWQEGDILNLPEDYVLELSPKQTQRITNYEGMSGFPKKYDIILRCEGPLYEGGVYQGYQVEEEAPVEDGISDEVDVAPPRMRGPFLSILMGRPFFQRIMGDRSMSLQKPRSDPFPGYTPKPMPRGGPTPTPTPRRVVPRVAPPPRRRQRRPGRKGG